MFGQFGTLSLVLLFLLLSPREAAAHRLQVEATVRSFGAVQVEAWFESGDIPKAARVQVFAADGRQLTEGTLDDQGIFTFTYTDAKPLHVVVNAGLGHRAEVLIKKADLERGAPRPSAEVQRETGPQVRPLLFGLLLLLGVAITATLVRRAKNGPSARFR